MKSVAVAALLVLSLIVLADALSGPCTPGEVKKEDCNTCTCNAQGTLYKCTKKSCPKHVVKRETCTPGATFKKACNTCTCNKEGTASICTLKGCINNKN